jgi:hypothetical protein
MTSFRVDNFPGKGNGTAANEMAISSKFLCLSLTPLDSPPFLSGNSAKDDGKEKVASKDKGKQKAMNESQSEYIFS